MRSQGGHWGDSPQESQIDQAFTVLELLVRPKCIFFLGDSQAAGAAHPHEPLRPRIWALWASKVPLARQIPGYAYAT